MYWTACCSKDRQCRKANSDIVCYKKLWNDLKSHIKLFQYEIGKTYKLGHSLYFDSGTIHQGFHSYDSFPLKHRNFCPPAIVIAECIIPKGNYYINDYGEIISDAIKIVKILK